MRRQSSNPELAPSPLDWPIRSAAGTATFDASTGKADRSLPHGATPPHAARRATALHQLLRFKGVMAVLILLGYLGLIAVFVGNQRSGLVTIVEAVEKNQASITLLESVVDTLARSIVDTQAALNAPLERDTPADIGAGRLHLEELNIALEQLRMVVPTLGPDIERFRAAANAFVMRPSMFHLAQTRDGEQVLLLKLQYVLRALQADSADLSQLYRNQQQFLGAFAISGNMVGAAATMVVILVFFTRLARDIDRPQNRAAAIVAGYDGEPLRNQRRDEVGVVASGLMLAMASAFAQVPPVPPVGGATSSPYTPGAGITGTPHDWSKVDGTKVLVWLDAGGKQTTYNSTGVAAIDAASGKQITTTITIGQCTKCHTPHQAKSTNLLWNHTLSAVTYKWDTPATTAGTVYPQFKGDTYKGSTTKCLSCHDGLLASTDGMWFNRQMMTGSKYVGSGPTSGHEVAIGSNMSGSHPVATPYPLNGASNTYNSTANGANIAPTEWVADPMATNKIRLFNDNGAGDITAGAVAGKTGIECASCHDVHNGARAKDIRLLAGKINGSDRSPGGYICTQCHLK